MTKHEEIERRYILDGRNEKPWRVGAKKLEIKQYYFPRGVLSLTGNTLMFHNLKLVNMLPDEVSQWKNHSGWGGRLRVQDGVCIVTCKIKKSDDTNHELEWVVDGEVGAKIHDFGPFPHVEKTRYVWTGSDNKKWEVDEFEGRLAGLVLAEIELKTSSEEFVKPEWLGHDITGLGSWSNRSLADTIGN
ncbi:hypothetical protein N9K54_05180 [Candidatus Poseidonia alphae]|nr:hypothetical protein [Candidatus Poseidonia alphae]